MSAEKQRFSIAECFLKAAQQRRTPKREFENAESVSIRVHSWLRNRKIALTDFRAFR